MTALAKRRIQVEPFLTPTEVAAALRVNRSTIHRMVKRGELLALRVGTDFRIRESEFQRFLKFGGRIA